MTNARIVLTTVGLKDAAQELARQLVERRLAACVNIVGPMRSIYRWNHKLHDEQEYLLVIKTTAEHAAAMPSLFTELHPYELPECVQLPIEGGSQAYLAWLAAEVSSGD
jgi:periplasmic divalent cation tolerance protein